MKAKSSKLEARHFRQLQKRGTPSQEHEQELCDSVNGTWSRNATFIIRIIIKRKRKTNGKGHTLMFYMLR